MRTTTALLVWLICLWSLPAQSDDATRLWRTANVGMSLAELLEAVPGSVKSAGSTLGTGAVERARLSDLRLVGETFSAVFYFDDTGLVQVTLMLDDADAFSLRQLETIYRDAFAALTAEYGEPFESTTMKDVLTIHTSDWYRNGIHIGVICMTIEGDVNQLNINYQALR